MKRMPNIRHLRAFCEVARRGSISQAAEHVHLSQPAITQAIAKLEEEVGVSLFDRRPDGMAVSAAGALFLDRAERALERLRTGTREAIRIGGRKGARGLADFDQLLTVAQIRALTAVADAGNFSLAARTVGISQPTIHRAARDLERLSGLSLFVRTVAGIALTPPAKALVQHVKLAVAEMEQGFAEVGEGPGGDSARIVVGSMPLSRPYILPTAVNALVRERPDVHIDVIDGPYDDLLHGLRHGEIDVLIGALRDPLPIDDVVQEPLFEDPLAVVARAFHPLSRKAALTPDDLAGCQWVVPRRGTPTRDRFETLFASRRPRGLVETSSQILVRGLLLGSDRLTLISAHQIRHEHELGLLVILPVDLGGTERPIGLTVRRGWHPTATQERFLALLREAGRQAASPVPRV
ncbi:LysR family transcriptional regulator [Azospirillum sp. RWY-5-1]|uniref:LysR family transcriptional regulator n=1 Tax=Azospirillum oleiclasticum TaxID=2735135 RepID=A0ABX2TL42_9PROT|nr:LysR family transcriptional regulator [Azospirillum oleiclasticum]NYZ17470.1 LysR family transcriptional regulator [Azospirillum oleiclasticum]NYZ24849.1 LysR family transcriptional regulator [Azospirillum oleiclasticum]